MRASLITSATVYIYIYFFNLVIFIWVTEGSKKATDVLAASTDMLLLLLSFVGVSATLKYQISQ